MSIVTGSDGYAAQFLNLHLKTECLSCIVLDYLNGRGQDLDKVRVLMQSVMKRIGYANGLLNGSFSVYTKAENLPDFIRMVKPETPLQREQLNSLIECFRNARGGVQVDGQGRLLALHLGDLPKDHRNLAMGMLNLGTAPGELTYSDAPLTDAPKKSSGCSIS